MATHDRGRSPSAGQPGARLNTAASASPRRPLIDASYAATDNALASDHYAALANPGAYANPSYPQDNSGYFLAQTYPDFDEQQQNLQQQQQQPLVPSQGDDISTHAFLQSQAFVGPGGPHVSSGALSHSNSPAGNDSNAFPSFDFNQSAFSQGASVDPTLIADLDPSQQLDPMAAMQSHSPTPPHLLPDMARRQSQSPSPQASPNFQQATFANMNRPRNVSESLDPSSAMYPQGQNEWGAMGAYRSHRRTPSDQYSDYSSHSNQASPYMQTYDSFENAHSSPLLNPQQDPTFNDGLGLQSFNLNENQPQQQQTYHTPGHSPHISPQLLPQQQALPAFTADNNFGLNNGQYVQQNNGLEMFPGAGQEPFPSLHKPQSPSDFGQADQMSPPEISIDYAPPAMNATGGQPLAAGNNGEALSPPMRTQSRNRIRAKSDSYAGSRSSSPGIPPRGRSPSLQPGMSSESKLSPFDNPSRSPSPRGRNGSASRNRSTSHASDQRDYILNLAEPDRSPSNGAKDNGRVQKHPATFQCTLCPKRFTRAYNLRSHLRTHTDERPFVCTVCGKAFARQHDRKRHEGLHSGEKKFVCKGSLQSGGQWGCGRRFARADALGRHFRSEAGRVCIKPLLDEEAAERQKAWMEEQQQAQVAAGLVAPQPMMQAPQMDMMGNFLPAAILQQYPALAGIDWSAMPPANPAEDDYSGRSSFEASSGGEYYEDLSGDEMGGPYSDAQMGGMGMGMQQGLAGGMQAQGGFVYAGAQQQQQQQQQRQGDYLSDFEGR